MTDTAIAIWLLALLACAQGIGLGLLWRALHRLEVLLIEARVKIDADAVATLRAEITTLKEEVRSLKNTVALYSKHIT
jgi:hypothetical protein